MVGQTFLSRRILVKKIRAPRIAPVEHMVTSPASTLRSGLNMTKPYTKRRSKCKK